jgi:hypothetical protein
MQLFLLFLIQVHIVISHIQITSRVVGRNPEFPRSPDPETMSSRESPNPCRAGDQPVVTGDRLYRKYGAQHPGYV